MAIKRSFLSEPEPRELYPRGAIAPPLLSFEKQNGDDVRTVCEIYRIFMQRYDHVFPLGSKKTDKNFPTNRPRNSPLARPPVKLREERNIVRSPEEYQF